MTESLREECLIECYCGTHAVKFSSFSDEEEVYVSFWTHKFYLQSNYFEDFVDRIKFLWKVLTRGPYLVEELVLTRRDLEKLRDYLNRKLEGEIVNEQ